MFLIKGYLTGKTGRLIPRSGSVPYQSFTKALAAICLSTKEKLKKK